MGLLIHSSSMSKEPSPVCQFTTAQYHAFMLFGTRKTLLAIDNWVWDLLQLGQFYNWKPELVMPI